MRPETHNFPRRRRPVAGALALALLFAAPLFPEPSLAAQEEEARRHEERHVLVLRGADGGLLEAAGGAVRGGFLGVQLLDLTPELRAHFGAPEGAGVMISKLVDEGPAASAGLAVGDIVLRFDDLEIGGSRELSRAVAARKGGETASLEVLRGGATHSLTVLLGERERHRFDLGELLSKQGLGPSIGDLEHFELPLEIDSEALEQALERLNTELSSPEWRRRLEALGAQRHDLDGRLEALERRLEELERQLERIE